MNREEAARHAKVERIIAEYVGEGRTPADAPQFSDMDWLNLCERHGIRPGTARTLELVKFRLELMAKDYDPFAGLP